MCITSITGNVILSEAKDLDSSPAAQNDKKKAPDTLGTFDTRDTFIFEVFFQTLPGL